MQPSGVRLWRLAYRFNGKQKLLALGSYRLISLADARQARDDAKRLLVAGIDPARERSLRKTVSARDTFRLIVDVNGNRLVWDFQFLKQKRNLFGFGAPL